MFTHLDPALQRQGVVSEDGGAAPRLGGPFREREGSRLSEGADPTGDVEAGDNTGYLVVHLLRATIVMFPSQQVAEEVERETIYDKREASFD